MNEVSTPLLNSDSRQHADAESLTSLVVTSQLSQSASNVPMSSGLDLPRGFLHDEDALALRTPTGDRLELQGGEQKTQTIWLSLGQEDAELQMFDWTHQPVRVCTPRDWHFETKAIPYFCPASIDPHSRLTTLLDEAAKGEHSLTAKRDAIDEYGWRNFSELQADHEAAFYDGPRPIISHYNNQFDSVYGGLLQLARTGDAAWFDQFDPLARHVADIDSEHQHLQARQALDMNWPFLRPSDHDRFAARLVAGAQHDKHFEGGHVSGVCQLLGRTELFGPGEHLTGDAGVA
jgi:hypothetical protein